MSIPVRVDPNTKAHVVRAGILVAADFPHGGSHDCPVCDEPLILGPVSLVYVGRYPDNPHSWTAAAVAVHDVCTDQEGGTS